MIQLSDIIVQELSHQFQALPETLIINDKHIQLLDFIEASLPNNSVGEISSALGVSSQLLLQKLSRKYRPIFTDKPKGTSQWGRYFLAKIGYTLCSQCLMCKDSEDFSCRNDLVSGKRTICRECASDSNKKYYANNTASCNDRSRNHYLNNKQAYIAKSAKRRAWKLQATPSWANSDAIRSVYSRCTEGYHVDHIIPLIHPLVCGLHVENNLQIITATENLQKSNSFTIT